MNEERERENGMDQPLSFHQTNERKTIAILILHSFIHCLSSLFIFVFLRVNIAHTYFMLHACARLDSIKRGKLFPGSFSFSFSFFFSSVSLTEHKFSRGRNEKFPPFGPNRSLSKVPENDDDRARFLLLSLP